MSETPSSKSQDRALRLLGLPACSTYAVAASTLETAGAYADGLPRGTTWRAAAKLSDADLVAGVQIDYERDAPRREWRDIIEVNE